MMSSQLQIFFFFFLINSAAERPSSSRSFHISNESTFQFIKKWIAGAKMVPTDSSENWESYQALRFIHGFVAHPVCTVVVLRLGGGLRREHGGHMVGDVGRNLWIFNLSRGWTPTLQWLLKIQDSNDLDIRLTTPVEAGEMLFSQSYFSFVFFSILYQASFSHNMEPNWKSQNHCVKESHRHVWRSQVCLRIYEGLFERSAAALFSGPARTGLRAEFVIGFARLTREIGESETPIIQCLLVWMETFKEFTWETGKRFVLQSQKCNTTTFTLTIWRALLVENCNFFLLLLYFPCQHQFIWTVRCNGSIMAYNGLGFIHINRMSLKLPPWIRM